MSNTSSDVPSWVEPKLFEGVLKETLPKFKKIKHFKAFNALPPGENYATIMLRIEAVCELENAADALKTFMLKVPHDNEMYREELSKWHMFRTESGMYRDIKAEFEQLYRDAGKSVQFGAMCYTLPTQKEYVLLEDLSKKGFRNVKRQDCLDMQHCKNVLKKLAQWHAASAVRVQRKGMFDPIYTDGMIKHNGIEFCKTMFDNSIKYILKTVQKFPNHAEYYKELETLGNQLTDVLFERSAMNPAEFNVLNHGDCWANNIMFRYDEDGKLQESLLVDFQMPRYGTPAQDLWYFIISSAQIDIKISKFDYMIRYYYDHLIENLKLLKYDNELPSLRHIHQMLIKYGIWAMITINSTMAAVLCEPTDTANLENFVGGESGESNTFREILYSNENFCKYLEPVLYWLYHKGAFEC